MNGKVSVKSQRDRILNSIATLCQAEQSSQKKKVRSTTLELATNELVRDMMRERARAPDEFFPKGEILQESLTRAKSEIKMRLEAQQINYDLNRLFTVPRKDLKRTGSELEKLSSNLFESKRTKRVREVALGESPTARPFTIHQIGLEGFPTGLLAKPDSSKGLTLDFDQLRNDLHCEIRGDWFPAEVSCRGHIFVIDDDGSVFVSVDGLPMQAVQEIEALLQTIVESLYE